MTASEKQIREQAQAIANQAQAIADGKFTEPQEVWAQASLIFSNAETLRAWAAFETGKAGGTPPEGEQK